MRADGRSRASPVIALMEDNDLIELGTVRADDDNGIDVCFNTGLDRCTDQVPPRWRHSLLHRSYSRPAKLLSDRNQSRRQCERSNDQDLRSHSRLRRIGKIQPSE